VLGSNVTQITFAVAKAVIMSYFILISINVIKLHFKSESKFYRVTVIFYVIKVSYL